MIILKPVIICVFTLIICIILKNTTPHFVPVIALCSGIIVFFYMLPFIKSLTDITKNIGNISDETNRYIKLIIKITIVAVICEFFSQLCSDSGDNYLSKLIVFSGKLIIMNTLSPYIISFIETILVYIKEV